MSKNIMFYFSGTGNSLSVASRLADQLGDASLLPILSIEENMVVTSDVETVGLIYPIYMNATPQNIKDFIGRLKFEGNCYVYAIATHGGVPGKAGCYLHKLFNDNGIELNGYFEIEMINNSPKGVAPKFLMRLEWEKDITEDKITPVLQQAMEQIPSIASSIQDRSTSSLENFQAKEQGLSYHMMKLLWKLSESSVPKLQFILDDGCIGCGKCEKICTTNRIKLVEGRPHWEGEKCNYCYACFNFCSAQAIGVKYYTKKSGRYHFPGVTWEDIAAQKNF